MSDKPGYDELAARVERLQQRIGRLCGALAFAASCIKAGEPWTTTCEREIGGALADLPRTKGDSHG